MLVQLLVAMVTPPSAMLWGCLRLTWLLGYGNMFLQCWSGVTGSFTVIQCPGKVTLILKGQQGGPKPVSFTLAFISLSDALFLLVDLYNFFPCYKYTLPPLPPLPICIL